MYTISGEPSVRFALWRFLSDVISRSLAVFNSIGVCRRKTAAKSAATYKQRTEFANTPPQSKCQKLQLNWHVYRLDYATYRRIRSGWRVWWAWLAARTSPCERRWRPALPPPRLHSCSCCFNDHQQQQRHIIISVVDSVVISHRLE